jgi:Anti-sigma-K factor rskA/Putative zinc-finger
MSRLTCEEARELLPLLALNALDVDERDVVDDHLTGCSACQEELAGYTETAAALALALPQSDPSSTLKGRLLAEARRARLVASDSTRGRIPSPPISRVQRVSGWRTHLSSLVAGVALALAAGSTAWALSLRSELDAQNARIATLSERANNYARVTAVLQAADTQIRVLESTGGAPDAFGRVYIDPDTSEGMLMVRNLPPLPQGRVYQLWVAGADGTRQSAGLLTWTDKAGNGYTLIKCPETLSRWQSFGVTEEPAGGSQLPTGSRLLGGTI